MEKQRTAGAEERGSDEAPLTPRGKELVSLGLWGHIMSQREGGGQ